MPTTAPLLPPSASSFRFFLHHEQPPLHRRGGDQEARTRRTSRAGIRRTVIKHRRFPYWSCLGLFVLHISQFIETGLKLMKKFGEEHATAQKEIVEQFITLEEGMAAILSEGSFFFGERMSLAERPV